MNIARKLLRSIEAHGIGRTIAICLRYPGIRLRRGKLQRALSTKDPRTIFNTIHRANLWANHESASGPGSTMAYTQNLREQLPAMLKQFGVRKLYDAPCGDFNWMSAADLQALSIEYDGADIVGPIIEKNQDRFSGPARRFHLSNITCDPFPTPTSGCAETASFISATRTS